ncbi:carbohydrate kinase family protein [Lachnospiraceae bacterium 54-53]
MKYQEGNKKVVVAGHISLDITPVFKNSGGQKLLELFRPGKLMAVGGAKICTGGAVSNTGLGLHALGADVLLMSKVGEDDFGRILKEKIRQSGCESCIPERPGEATSYTVVLAPRGLDRFFLHDPGCNDTFCCDDVDFKKIAGASHFHFGYPTLMRRFYEKDGKELTELFRRVKELGLSTSLDLAAVDPDSEAAGCDWKRILASALPYVDFFVPSIEELGYVLDRDLYDKWQEKAGGDDITSILSLSEDVEVLAGRALALGTKAVLLKCGAAGMYLKTAPDHVFAEATPLKRNWGGISHFQNSFVPDRILSATGAGDTSIGAFLKAMLDGLEPLECLELAAATGASCVTAYDAVSGLLPFDALKEKIRNGWKQQEIIRP